LPGPHRTPVGEGEGHVGVEPNTGVSEFTEFVDALRGQRAESERIVRRALRRVGDRYPERFLDEVRDMTSSSWLRRRTW